MSGRLPSCTAAEVARAVEHGGFIFVHQKGSHRYFADPITGDIGAVRIGEKAVFNDDAYPGRSFEGVVAKVRQAPARVGRAANAASSPPLGRAKIGRCGRIHL